MKGERGNFIRFFLIIFLVILSWGNLFAQVPTVQDCGAAIPICKNIYTTTVSYHGMGNYPNEVNLGNCLYLGGEANSVWYTFTVQTSGKFSFVLTPNTSSDDYDWGVFNMTNANCSDIYSNASLMVSCNASGNTGQTGASTAKGGSANSNGPNNTNKFNADIPVLAGETYMIMVSNWSNGAPGYTIDFSGSTAVIFDNVPPKIKQIKNTLSCGSNSISFDFTENILCNTISTCDISITGPGGPYTINSVSGNNCALGGNEENTFTVNFSPAISSGGNFNLNLNSSSCSSVTDLCGNVALTGSIPFVINSANANTTTMPSSCSLPNGSANVLAAGGSGGFTYSWNTLPPQTTSTISNLAAGTYSVTVTEANGCKIIKTATVVTNPVPVVSVNPANPTPFCVGGSVNLTANGAAAYQWLPSTALNSTTTASVIASPASTQTYSVIGTTAGCSDTAVVTVTVNPYPKVSVNPSNPAPFCVGGSVQLAASGAANYAWSPSAGLNASSGAVVIASPSLSQIYSVIGTSLGCSDTAYAKVSVMPLPISNAGSDVSFCSGGTSVLGAANNPAYAYSWSPVNGLDFSNVSNPQISLTNPNPIPVSSNYILTTTLGSCALNDTVKITVNPYPIANAGNDQVICSGENFVMGTTAVAGYTYLWSPSSGLSNASSAKPFLSLINPASTANDFLYSVKTTQYGCSSSDTVKITVKPAITANAGADVSICSGATASLGAPPESGFAYSWSPAAGLSNPNISNPSYNLPNNGNASIMQAFTLTKTMNGCFDIDSVFLVVRPLPHPDAGADVNICSGSTMSLGASPIAGYVYSWLPIDSLSKANISNPDFKYSHTDSVIKFKQYVLKATALGCSNTDTILIGIKPIPVSNAGIDVAICSGGSVNLGAKAKAGYTYNWSPSLGLNDNSISDPMLSLNNFTNQPILRTYTVMSSLNGCTSTDQVNITINTIPIANAGNDIQFCSGSSLSIGSPPSASNTYQWIPGKNLSDSMSSNPLIRIFNTTSVPQSYTYVLMSHQGLCVNSDTLRVMVNPIPISNAGRDTFICSAGKAMLGAAPNVGYRYAWSPSIGLNNDTISNPSLSLKNLNNAKFTRDYVVTTTAFSCMSKDTVVVDVYYALNAHFKATPDTVCAGELVDVSYIGNANATANYHWSFDGGNLMSGSGQGPYLIKWNISGTHLLTLSLDDQGCFSPTDSVNVLIHAIPPSDAGSDVTLCSLASGFLGNISKPNQTYSWSPALGLDNPLISNPKVSIENLNPNASANNFVLTTTENNCSSTDTVSVFVYPIPVAAIKPLQGQCLTGNQFNFTSLGILPYTHSYDWNFGPNANILTSNLQNPGGIVFSNSGYQSISLYVTQNGCVGKVYTDSVFIYSMPQVSFTPDAMRGCVPLEISFEDKSLGGGSCSWDFGDTEKSSDCLTKHIYTKAGIYDLAFTATSSDGCAVQLIKSNLINVYPLPQASCSVDPPRASIFRPEVHLVSNSIGSTKCFWEFGDQQSSDLCDIKHLYPDTGIYQIRLLVSNAFGCTDISSCSVYIEPEFMFYVPNAFTPDDDGLNDTFNGFGKGFNTYSLVIFNRWGNEIYTTNDYEHPWDGKTNKSQTKAEMGVYVYKIELRDDLGEWHKYVGRVSLIR